MESTEKHTGRSSYPYLLPLPRSFCCRWAGEPIWNLQKNIQVGAPTPTSYPYLVFLGRWAGEPIWNPPKNKQTGAPTPASYPLPRSFSPTSYPCLTLFVADGRVNQFGIRRRKKQVGAPTPCLLPPTPAYRVFFWGQWAGEPIWTLQKNIQVGAPTPTSYPYLTLFLAYGRVNQFGICRKTHR